MRSTMSVSGSVRSGFALRTVTTPRAAVRRAAATILAAGWQCRRRSAARGGEIVRWQLRSCCAAAAPPRTRRAAPRPSARAELASRLATAIAATWQDRTWLARPGNRWRAIYRHSRAHACHRSAACLLALDLLHRGHGSLVDLKPRGPARPAARHRRVHVRRHERQQARGRLVSTRVALCCTRGVLTPRSGCTSMAGCRARRRFGSLVGCLFFLRKGL